MIKINNRALGIEQISSFFKNSGFDMRIIKLILRKADINYQNMVKDGWKPDWRIAITFEASKYVETEGGEQLFLQFKNTNNPIRSSGKSEIFQKLLFIITQILV